MLGKLNRYLTRFSIFLIIAALIAGMVGCDGDGYTPSQNLEIRTWYDLDDVRDNLSGNHTLMNDLDSNTAGYTELASPTADEGRGWYPIGIFSQGGVCRFTGTLDGQGHEICDLFINRTLYEPPNNGCGIGLVGVLGRGGVVKNIGVVNVTVTGDEFVGGLVGSSYGTVTNSYSTGSVTGLGIVGGLAGSSESYSIVSNSYSTANVTGNVRVGGLVGRIGNNHGDSPGRGTVTNSYSTGSVTGGEYVGGLVGWKYGTVSNSFWDIETSGQATSDGGTGKNTTEMQEIITFLDAGWNITTVALNQTNTAYIWNIVNNVTYPFLSWQP